MQTLVGAIPDQVERLEPHGSAILAHLVARTTHGRDPLGYLVGVAHSRREAHQRHLGGQVDDDLLPHRTAIGVLEEVDLVEHDDPERTQAGTARIDHVAQDLGGHDHDGRVTVDRVVAGQQTDLVGSQPLDEVVVLLVREGLDRGRVERTQAIGPGGVDRVLGHDCLAATGGSGDEHRAPLVEGVEGPELEVVERERVVGDQVGTVGAHAAQVPDQPAAASRARFRFWAMRPMTIEIM